MIFCLECWLCVLKRLFYFSCSLQNDTEVKVTATCIRVPVMRAHAESVNLQFENPLAEVVLIHIKPVLLLNLLFNSYFDALDSSIWYQRY